MPIDTSKLDAGSFGVTEEEKASLSGGLELKGTLGQAMGESPVEYAKTMKLSRQSGVPVNAVRTDPGSVERKLRLDNIDVSKLQGETPKTAGFLAEYDNAVIAQDDIDILSGIETLLAKGAKTVSGMGGTFSSPVGMAARASALAYSAATDIGEKTFDNLGGSIATGYEAIGRGIALKMADTAPSRVDDLVPSHALPLGMQDLSYEISRDMARNMGIDSDEQLQQANEGAVEYLLAGLRELEQQRKDLTPEDLTLLEQGVRSGIESLALQAPAVLAMLASGGRAAPALAMMGTQTYATSYGSSRAEGLSTDEAHLYATIDAAIEVGTEILPTITLQRLITGKVEGSMSKEMLKFAVREMGTEQLATLGKSLNAYVFGLDEEMEQADTVEEKVQIQLQRQAVTAIATVVAGGAQAGAGASINKALSALEQRRLQSNAAGEAEQGQVDAMADMSKKSTLRERDPELFKQFLQRQDSDSKPVFIDSAQVALYLNSKTPKERREDPVLQLLDKKVQDARDTQEDVQVSVTEFMTDLAPSDHFDSLRPLVSLSTESASPFRREQDTQEHSAYVDRLVASSQANVSEYVEAQNIYESVKSQLIDTGRVSEPHAAALAKVVPAWAVAKAKRDGVSVASVYEKAGLKIEGPQTGKMATLEEESALLRQASITFRDDVSREEFSEALMQARESRSEGLAVSLMTTEQLEGYDTYLTEGGDVGFAISPEGVLSSVFKKKGSSIGNAMDMVVPMAIERGATKLQAFEGFLSDSYARFGFRETSRDKFDEDLAPEGWDYKALGRPDLITMELDQNERNTRQTDPRSETPAPGAAPSRESDGSLAGLPREPKRFRPRHHAPIAEVAKAYVEAAGVEYQPPSVYAPVDVERAKRIAQEYDKMEHAPDDPTVIAAYAALAEETTAQYKAAVDAGLVVEFIDFEATGDPYAESPRLANEDIIENNHMWVFATADGFGSSEEFDPAANPLLAETEFLDVNGKPMLLNDLFRVVHDYFGHAKEGLGFRAAGEENAWRAHAAMFSPLARRALTTETRGQNSWVNFGPHGDANRRASAADTVFADQKTGIMPEWVSEEGRTDSEALYQFAGESSLTAPVNALNAAKRMEEEGSTRNAIYDETGWFKGVDGRWRYEISDDDAKLASDLAQGDIEAKIAEIESGVTYESKEAELSTTGVLVTARHEDGSNALGRGRDDALYNLAKALLRRERKVLIGGVRGINGLGSGTSVPLSKILDHPALFAAYPALGEVRVSALQDTDDGTRAVFFPQQNRMEISPELSDSEMLSTLLHEIQHAIQEREGFASGGSSDPQYISQVKAALGQMEEEYAADYERVKDSFGDKIRDAEDSSNIARDALKYQSVLRLMDYASREKPSGVFRLIKNELDWIYGGEFQSDDVIRKRVRDLEGLFHSIPKTGKKRNDAIRAVAETGAQIVRDTIEPINIMKFKEDPRTLKGMIKALERQSSKARAALSPLHEAEERAKSAKELKKATEEKSPFHVYRALLGEVEARTTQDRQPLTLDERLRNRPWLDYDVPEAEAVVIIGGREVTLPLTMQSREMSQARGYYEPANNLIRLTEASDLSTFLHEFAHFMYEQELITDGVMVREAQSWLLRNAEDVASEANGLIGERRDMLEQEQLSFSFEDALVKDREVLTEGLDMSHDARMMRAEQQGFDTSTVYYHGTDRAGFKSFDLPWVGKTRGTGVFFTDDEQMASTYQRGRAEDAKVYTGEEIFEDPSLIEGLEIRPVYTLVYKDGGGEMLGEGYATEEELLEENEIDDEVAVAIRYHVVDPEGYDLFYVGSREEVVAELEKLEVREPGVYSVFLRKVDPENFLSIDWQGNSWVESPTEAWDLVDQDGDVVDFAYSEEEAEARVSGDETLAYFEPTPGKSTDEYVREAKDMGFSGVEFINVNDPGPYSHGGEDGNVRVVFDVTEIRSTRAAFDPAKSSSDNILAQSPELPNLPEGAVTAEHVKQYVTTGTTGSAAVDAALRVATHEQFARGFETYLTEGKSPSIEMRNVFRKFATWLAQIYRAIKGDLRVNLDDKMREVFDRLLATEDQIEMAKARAKFEPLFTDATVAGMTDEKFAEYQAGTSKVSDAAQETLREKLVKDITRKTEKWWKEEKRALVDEISEEIETRKVYAAATRLKNDLKLDKATVKAMVGEEVTDRNGRKSVRPPASLRGMTIDGARGMHPDDAAAMLGYSSGSEMLADVMKAPSVKSVAEAEAEAQMVDTHGDVLNDGSIEARADGALVNEERGEMLLAELKALSRGGRETEKQAIKSLAEEKIARLAYREIHPGKYRKAELRAAQESASMLAKGNREGAADAKQRQVTNYYLGMAAQEARDGIDKIVSGMSRYEKKKVKESILKSGGGHWEQITKILRRFEFRRTASLASVDRANVAVTAWMNDRIQNHGDGLLLDPAVLDEAFTTHWKNVPYEDLKGIADSVKNIDHVARYINKIDTMQDKIDYDTLVSNWLSHTDDLPTVYTPTASEVNDDQKVIPWAMAQMTKVPFLASWLDGGERVGLSHDIMVQPFADAHDEEQKLWALTGSVVMDAIADRTKDDIRRHGEKIFILEIGMSLRGQEILAVAMNTGNAGNLRKLLLGEGWANPDNDAEISINNPKLQAVLKHMTKSDWDLVQLVWDQMDLLYPKLAEVHRRTTGLVPPKVEKTPVETPFGSYAGGYYPMKYDPNRSTRAEELQERLDAETESMFGGSMTQISISAGATNERTQFFAPVRLSLDVIPNHFQETIHYITHHDAVRTMNRLLKDPRVSGMIKAKMGKYEFQQLKPWLNDIAKDGREAPAKLYWEKALARLRFGATLGYMGFKASTGLMQLLGLSNTAAEVGTANLFRGLRSVIGSPETMQKSMEFAVEHSKVMEYRAKEFDREIKNAMEKLRGKRGALRTAQELSMKHIALIQTYIVDLPTWHAAYGKELSQSGDEIKAAKYADWVVENIQGSGRTANMAAVMRSKNEANRMFTMFMTFFSSLWNIERDLARGAKSSRYSATDVGARAALLFVVPVIAEMALRGELFPADDEDPEAVAEKALLKMALYPVASMPFVRDIANGVGSGYGYSMSPIGDLLEKGVKNIPALAEGALTDDEITRGEVKGTVQFMGAWFGVPGVSQAWATSEHLYQVIEEGEDLTLKEALYGPERK